MDINTKRKLRTAFMNWLFATTGGSQLQLGEASEFRVPHGWAGERPSESDIEDVIRFLEGEYLVQAHWSMGELPSVQLTHEGIREMEQLLSEPTERTEHFVPLVNITNIHGSVIGSQIQQGSPGATQTGHIEVNQRDNAEAFITAARKILGNDNLDSGTRAQTEADLAVMSRELESPTPRWPILQMFGTSVRDSLVKAAGTAAAAGILTIPWP
ncbi:hypothetical protein [Micromonospora siamensis]|uniref:Uncharacterized protein n=1 Tax=Micromonospora siamensis TaxID=299152 RepID=A0A1C5I955_9ACTN|nr:hypothetical protein [Micromonospora siamensis]SCG55012.1 hypothetical protein GA0074704_3113 [Micromonospora siamensis]